MGAQRRAISLTTGGRTRCPHTPHAQALLDTLDRDDPPFRLLLGNVAYDVAIERYQSRLEEFRAGEPIARGADNR
jgi:hypothetical protein